VFHQDDYQIANLVFNGLYLHITCILYTCNPEHFHEACGNKDITLVVVVIKINILWNSFRKRYKSFFNITCIS